MTIILNLILFSLCDHMKNCWIFQIFLILWLLEKNKDIWQNNFTNVTQLTKHYRRNVFLLYNIKVFACLSTPWNSIIWCRIQLYSNFQKIFWIIMKFTFVNVKIDRIFHFENLLMYIYFQKFTAHRRYFLVFLCNFCRLLKMMLFISSNDCNGLLNK